MSSSFQVFTEAWEIARKVRLGEWRAVDVVDKSLRHIHAQNTQLNAFTQITEARARHEAEQIDRKIARGEDPGALAGVPFAVKNLFDVEGEVTLAGSRINRRDDPASMDATLVQRMNSAGAVLLGALNMGEYAYDFTGENIHYGPSRNPHDGSRMTGGSSGGSGAAVAGGMVPIALGSDTNGSIRVPSSLCGIFGFKPTYGRLSRAGTFPFCPSLDHVGPMARSVTDLARVYEVLQGYDHKDPASVQRDREPVISGLDEGVAQLKIAIAGGYFLKQASTEAELAIQKVADCLGVNEEVEIVGAVQARAAAYLITNAESSNLHLERLRRHAGDYDPDVRDRMLAGTLLPASWVIQAQRFRSYYRAELQKIFAKHDLLIAPATPMTAPQIGQRSMELGGETMLVRPHLGLYTQPFSFIGLPVVVVPVAAVGIMPIGVQIIAAPWQEAKALRVARYLELSGFTSPLPQN
ncbi:amidase [Acidithiobacillus thiooxidans]|uniref:Amidase n=1 Tax=Acidithiobacillus thiooxidans TaxID=930 RepID=A0A1C2ILM5_ACITH|nr:AtzE family amidohydrolase [Acidithiobacillus thiooxidans]OCX69569.1 amidase [Acidithiobacillus thiooxidans]OCX75338.1 amidase [Acidithiobacillus thiooxidans]OCX76870.1 amidase [Acidithiobacillus thiooxidans]OCX82175.1 amidase [Acidithiobacillus thiooxidans]OCX87076.1 amidase [Acidithiobacillus thiooxidans]